jgi:lysozyme family protein
MSALVEALIDRVIAREGRRYVDDPADAGGPTRFGITLATLHLYRGTPVAAADVAALTEEEARAIYRRLFVPPAWGLIPDAQVLELLFDYAVNSGPAAAARSLQAVLKREGLYDGPVDGELGPLSAAALAQVRNWPALFFALKCERYELLLRLVGSAPSQAAYAAGWANRLDGLQERLQ